MATVKSKIARACCKSNTYGLYDAVRTGLNEHHPTPIETGTNRQHDAVFELRSNTLYVLSRLFRYVPAHPWQQYGNTGFIVMFVSMVQEVNATYSAADINRSVRSLFFTHDHKFQNVFIHAWEADHFSVTKTGYSYEVEVKISRSDYFADFKKPKHTLIKSIFEKKHPGKAGYSNCPNRFYFACPAGLIKSDELPKYAGLIYREDVGCCVVKKAPLLHDVPFNEKEMLFYKYYYGYLSQSQQIRELKSALDRYKGEENGHR